MSRKYFNFGGLDFKKSLDSIQSIDSFQFIDDTDTFLERERQKQEKEKQEEDLIERKEIDIPIVHAFPVKNTEYNTYSDKKVYPLFLSASPEKKKKKAIPKHIRKIVWDTYIGNDIIKHKCLCCKRTTICNTDFHCGHVVAENKGGTQEITNLRPICAACNLSMGTMNMVEYVTTFGLYIG
jgi:5-methylcytosine-specific restriction endonuclease McrA